MINPPREVDELYQKLRAESWIQPWLDEEELYPGQDWDLAIESLRIPKLVFMKAPGL